MKTPRFFCSLPLVAHKTLVLPQEVAHHVHVLRLKVGEVFTLFDGQGQEFQTQLTVDIKQNLSSAPISVELSSATEVDRERKGQITLIQGLATADKMDWVIEKAVELGVHRVIPVSAHRSVLRLDERRALKKHLHWQRIVQSASEQCGRNVLMQVDLTCSLEQALKSQVTPEHNKNNDMLWVANPMGARPLSECIEQSAKTITSVAIAIGPEGGWSEQEIAMCLKIASAQTISLGPRVLRTETAGLAAVSMIGAYLNW
jgi:16S rRNA (uracil1498-N3)-methyltransferase